MDPPDDGTAPGPTETLRSGPSRPPLSASVPEAWRRRAVGALGLVLGLAAGAGAAIWWTPDPEPRPAPRTPPDTHDVELVLTEVSSPGEPGAGPLEVGGAVLLSGNLASTVTRIEASNRGVVVRTRPLPVTVTRTERLAPVELRIRVVDCERRVPARPPRTAVPGPALTSAYQAVS